jgi:hypothetical protein
MPGPLWRGHPARRQGLMVPVFPSGNAWMHEKTEAADSSLINQDL